MRKRVARLIGGVTGIGVLALAWIVLSAAAARIPPRAYLRVNQVGYTLGAPRRALLMSSAADAGSPFTVLNARGKPVLRGKVGRRLRPWSGAFPYVYAIDLRRLDRSGRYAVKVSGHVIARSPWFAIGPAARLYRRLLYGGLFYFEAQRDGPYVIPGVLGRRPSHLHDRSASVYAKPSDANLLSSLHRVGGQADVSGGWFDAGDYLKFLETASYVESIMLLGIRDYPSELGAGAGRSDFAGEARFGLDWLRKMWRDSSRTLYYQVGIGDGNGASVLGDHDLWRLPQVDDRLSSASERYEARRPVFRSGPPGSRISPNLAGRLAADLALCFQVLRREDAGYADSCLLEAEHVFALADTAPGALTTASPSSYYPETEWRDDMELGAVELYLALARGHLPTGLPVTSPLYYLRQAAHWARSYLLHSSQAGYDSLNLYDVSGLAHYELYRALKRTRGVHGLEVRPQNLLDDCRGITASPTGCGTLRDELVQAAQQAAHDPFGLGFGYTWGDVVPHALGVSVEARLYDALTRRSTFAQLGQHQLDFALGANAWGSSFVVGAGSVFPHCLQHQVANLMGRLNGTRPLLLGATVDGPSADRGAGLPGRAPGAAAPRRCSVPGFQTFDGHGVAYRDGAADWPNTEPADDYTAISVLAFAQAARGP